MKIQETKSNDVYIISLSGKIDTTNYRSFEEKIKKALEKESRFLIDCTNLEYISSAGIRVFLMALKAINNKNGELKLCGLREETKEIFDLSGFSDFFDTYFSQDEALKSFS